MNEYVLVNDIHLSDRAPASCTDTYLDDLFELLEQISSLAQSRDAGIVLAGDVFHVKTPSRTSHSTVMRLIDWARQALVPVWAVPGNHDLLHDRYASLHESQPLGVVIASGAIQLLDGWAADGEPLYGVPWLMTYDDANVTDALARYRETLLQTHLHVRHYLVVTHAPLYPPGQELPYENYPAAAWAKAMLGIGTVHYGHVHERHGIYTVRDVTFSNPGALSRGSLTEAHRTRTPAVAIWNSSTGEIAHHDLRAKPADEVFRLAEVAEKKSAAGRMNDFLARVLETRLDVSDTAAVLDHVRANHDDPALVKVIAELLEPSA